MFKRQSRFILILTLFLLFAMGNTAAPNAPCLDKQIGELCTPVGYMSCRNSGTCQHLENSGFRDDPSTLHDETLICLDGAASLPTPAPSPLKGQN